MKKRLKEPVDASVDVSTPPPPDSPTKAPQGDAKKLRATLDRARELAAKVQRRTEEEEEQQQQEVEESDRRDTGIQDRLVKERVDVTTPLAHNHS